MSVCPQLLSLIQLFTNKLKQAHLSVNLLLAAYGKVFLVRKISGHDEGKLYAMKVCLLFPISIIISHTYSYDHHQQRLLQLLSSLPHSVSCHWVIFWGRMLNYVTAGHCCWLWSLQAWKWRSVRHVVLRNRIEKHVGPEASLKLWKGCRLNKNNQELLD